MEDGSMMRLFAQADFTARSVFSSEFWHDLWQTARTSVLSAIGEIVLVVILFFVTRLALFKIIDRVLFSVRFIESLEERRAHAARVRTLQGLAKSVTSYLLFFVAALMVLRAVRVDPLPLLTTASVAGLAVGFGAQKLVRDVISGFFIILENQYSVGDYVTIGAITGTVEEIGMRTTYIRDDVGKLHIIANADIGIVTNHCRGTVVSILDVPVAIGTDLTQIRVVLEEIGREIAKDRKDVLTPFEFQGVIAIDAIKMTLRMKGKIDPKYQEVILMDLRERIRNRFLDEQIPIL